MQYNVAEYLSPILDFVPPGIGRPDNTPTKEQVMGTLKQQQSAAAAATREANLKRSTIGQRRRKSPPPTSPVREVPSSSTRARPRLNLARENAADRANSTAQSTSPHVTSHSPTNSPVRTKKPRTEEPGLYYNPATNGFQPASYPPVEGGNADRHRAVLMAIFLNDDPGQIPELLISPNPPQDLDIDLIIDKEGHSSLHWAAALARVNILRLLVRRGANIAKVNYNGESALIRAVLVTNNYDAQCFPDLLELLSPTIHLPDLKSRTVLHHIALTAGIRGRVQASRYYLECLLQHIARTGGDFANLVDIQDKNGDTALNIAARVGNRNLVDQLLDVGANPNIPNGAGLRVSDFGFDDVGVKERKTKKILINQYLLLMIKEFL